MRKYTVSFMEQCIGVPRLTKIPGRDGEISFESADDDAALDYITDHMLERVKNCARAELSSMAIIPVAGGGSRVVDDSLENPHFYDMYINYDQRSNDLNIDFESTHTVLLPAVYRDTKARSIT